MQFDWTRILKAPPAADGQGRREGRDRDQRGRREPRPPQRSRGGGAPLPSPPRTPPPRPTPEVAAEHTEFSATQRTESTDLSATERTDSTEPPVPELSATPEPLGAEAADAADAAVEPVEPLKPLEPLEPLEPFSASYQRLGAEGLVRLRARYAEVMARIAERPLEEEARAELKLRAEGLNPDAWVTADEVTAALEQYETVFEGLRLVVGRHPRGRRRGRG